MTSKTLKEAGQCLQGQRPCSNVHTMQMPCFQGMYENARVIDDTCDVGRFTAGKERRLSFRKMCSLVFPCWSSSSSSCFLCLRSAKLSLMSSLAKVMTRFLMACRWPLIPISFRLMQSDEQIFHKTRSEKTLEAWAARSEFCLFTAQPS